MSGRSIGRSAAHLRLVSPAERVAAEGGVAEATTPRHAIRRRAFGLVAADLGAWSIGLVVASALRFEFDPARVPWGAVATCFPVVVVVVLGTGVCASLYGGRSVIGSADEVQMLGLTDLVATLVLIALDLVSGRPLPLGVVVGAALVAFLLSGGARLAWRRRRESAGYPSFGATRLLVMGAGEAGSSIVKQLRHDQDSPYLVVGFLDDDPMKRHLRIAGVPVLGSRAELVAIAASVHAAALLVAIPGASTDLVREVSRLAQRASLTVRVLPSATELLDGRVAVADIRPLAERDLLGRPSVHVDMASVKAAVHAKTVLVTGAGGSIGSELCRQLIRLEPAKLVMVDRDESALHATQLSISGQALFEGDDVVVADVRDADRIDAIFASFAPEVVFHAAALKHLALLEQHPGEALKTNVHGSENLLRAALAHDVETFVNVSTDKAADPVCVLGFTKRIAERLTAWAARRSDGRFVSVRFGNVLGSRGSLLTTFQSQIAQRHPVTVTHPDVTRYFMTVEEAVQLVLQASAIGRPGEVLVLDMGDPVSIRRLAERLVAESPGAPEIVFTGLRRGEKLHEVLFATGERDERPFHPAISHVETAPLDPHACARLESLGERDLVVALAALSQQPEAGAGASFAEPAYLVLDHQGLIASVSVAARQLLLTRHEHLVGRAPMDFAPALQRSDGSPFECRFPGDLDFADRPHEQVVGVRRGDASILWLAVSVRPVVVEGGVRHHLVMLRPVGTPPPMPDSNGVHSSIGARA